MAEDLLVFAAVGFAAQMVDGAVGMAYQRVDKIGRGAWRHKMLAHKSPMRRYMLRHP